MARYSLEKHLKNGTVIGVYVGPWYIGFKATKRGAYRGWVFGWYFGGRVPKWRHNFGRYYAWKEVE